MEVLISTERMQNMKMVSDLLPPKIGLVCFLLILFLFKVTPSKHLKVKLSLLFILSISESKGYNLKVFIFLSCKLYIHVCYSLFPGNKYIHLLTQAGNTVLRIEVKFVGSLLNTYSYAIEYSHFSVGNASTAYKLYVSGYSGLIGKHLKTLCRNINYIFLYNCYFVY